MVLTIKFLKKLIKIIIELTPEHTLFFHYEFNNMINTSAKLVYLFSCFYPFTTNLQLSFTGLQLFNFLRWEKH